MMGIHTLLKHILENPSCRERVELQIMAEEVEKATGKKAKLLCDYFSVLRWLLSSYDKALVKSDQLSPYCVLCSGNVHEYGPRVKEFVNILAGINVEPVFFVSGPPGSDVDDFNLKYELYKSETNQSIQHSALLQQITAGYQDLLQAEWRLDERALSQVRGTLKTYGTEVIQCLGEADREMIKYLRSHEEAMGVLSHNTDFAVADGSVLFLPELFRLSVDLQQLNVSEGVVCERITPSQLSKSLQITQRQIADLAVLCGNKYTKLFNNIMMENLGLDNHEIEHVTEWLCTRDENLSLLEYSNLREFLSRNPTYENLLKHSYELYYNSSYGGDIAFEEVTFPLSKPKSMVDIIRERVQEGSMQPSLFSIANGLYWRSMMLEPVALGIPSIHDTTMPLRKTLYGLMGLKQVTEYGRSASAIFAIIPVPVKFAVESGAKQLASLEAFTTAEKFSVLFHIIVNQKKIIRSFNLQDLLTVALKKTCTFKENIATPGAAVLTCASLLFMQYANRLKKPCHKINIGETDALLISCLACVCDIPPYNYPRLPSSRAVTVSTWFSHVLDQVYLIASYLGLEEELPLPADIFSSLSYFPFHDASFTLAEEDEATASVNLKGPYQFFSSVLDLEPVLKLRATILNKPKTPNLTQLVELFTQSIEAVTLYKDSLDLPSKEITLNHDILEAKTHLPDDYTFKSPRDTLLNSSTDGSVEYNELSSTQECQVSEEDVYFTQQSCSDDIVSLEVDQLTSIGGGAAPLDLSICESASSSVADKTGTHQPNWTELPVMSHREVILKLIKEHKVVCITGETGCGKSTKIPQFIYDKAINCDPPESCKILITQPRRVAAIRLAERVAEERRELVGHTVGFCIGGERNRSSTTPITYCTIGYLLQSLVHCPAIIHKYSHIILDEIHERSIETDFTLLVIRNLIVEATNTRIIIMSATLQGDLLVDYFEQVIGFSNVSSPYFVGAKHYPVETFCIDELCTIADRPRIAWHPCQAKASQSLKQIITSQPQESLKGASTAAPRITTLTTTVCTELVISQANLGESILIFLPGIAEITNYFEKLSSELIARGVDDHFSMFILHSQIPFEDQKEAFQAPPQNKVHVILATNIAESSITLPNLRMVINFGIYRQLQYDSKRHMSCLVKRWCSQSSCAQRAGRAGRVFEGVAVHLFSRRFYHIILSKHDPPGILTAPIAKLVLQAKQIGTKLGISSPSDFLSLAIEPPSLEQMETALKDLANLGAIVSIPGQPVREEAEITLLGHFSLSLPLELPLCRLVLFGVLFGIPTDAIVMAAAMSLSQDVFLLPSRSVITKSEEKFRRYLSQSLDARVEFDGGQFSDHILVRNMFMKWIQFRNENHNPFHPKHGLIRLFCTNHAVRWERLLQLECTVADIATRVLSTVPSEYQLYKELTDLASITNYRQGFKFLSSEETTVGTNVTINVHFCEDVLTLKALLVSAFPHQLMIGYREIDDAFSIKNAESAIGTVNNMQTVGFNCSESLVLSTRPASTPLQLLQLARTVLPHRQCDVRVMKGMDYMFHFLPQFLTNPKTEQMRAQAEARGEKVALSEMKIWQDFHNETSVSLKKPSKDLYLFWQFGERRPLWTVNGVDIQFTRPRHPLSVSWHQLSLMRESVLPLTWRNPVGFLCEFDMSPCQSGPYLGIASILEGREYRSFVTAKGVTVLPSLSQTPVALLMALAFQTQLSDVELLFDCSNEKIVGMKINSCRIPFPDSYSLSVEDLVRINILRGAISTVLRSYSEDSTLLPIELMTRIPSLLNFVLKQTPLKSTPAAIEAGPVMKSGLPSPIVRMKWESIFSCESVNEDDFLVEEKQSASLSSFNYFPPILCSLFESKNLALNIDTVMETDTPFIFEVTPTDTSHQQQQRKERKRHLPKRTLRKPFFDAPPPVKDMSLGSFKLSPLAQPFVPLTVNPLSSEAALNNTNNNNSANLTLPVTNSVVDAQQGTHVVPNSLSQGVVSHDGNNPLSEAGPGLHPNDSLHDSSSIHPLQHPLSQSQTAISLDPALTEQYKHSLLSQMMSNDQLLYRLIMNLDISPTDGTLSFQTPVTIGGLCQLANSTTTQAPEHADIKPVSQPLHLDLELQSTSSSSTDVECETWSSGEDVLSNQKDVSDKVDGTEKDQINVVITTDSPVVEEKLASCSSEKDSVLEQETNSGVFVEPPNDLEIEHQQQTPPPNMTPVEIESNRCLPPQAPMVASSSQEMDGTGMQVDMSIEYHQGQASPDRPNSCPPLFPLYQPYVPPLPPTTQYHSCPQFVPAAYPLQAPSVPSTLAMQYTDATHYNSSPQLYYQQQFKAPALPAFIPVPVDPASSNQAVHYITNPERAPSHYGSCPQLFPPQQLEAPLDPASNNIQYGSCPQLFPPQQLPVPAPPPQAFILAAFIDPASNNMAMQYLSSPQTSPSYYNSYPQLFPPQQLEVPIPPAPVYAPAPLGPPSNLPMQYISSPETYQSQYGSSPQLSSLQMNAPCNFPVQYQSEAPLQCHVTPASPPAPPGAFSNPTMQYISSSESSPSHYGSCPQLYPAPNTCTQFQHAVQYTGTFDTPSQHNSEMEYDSTSSCGPLTPPYHEQDIDQEIDEQETMPMEDQADSCTPLTSLQQLEASSAPSFQAVDVRETQEQNQTETSSPKSNSIFPPQSLETPSALTFQAVDESGGPKSPCPPFSLEASSASSTNSIDEEETLPLVSKEENSIETSPPLTSSGQEMDVTSTQPEDTFVDQSSSCTPLSPLNQLQTPLLPGFQAVDERETQKEQNTIETSSSKTNGPQSPYPPHSLEAPTASSIKAVSEAEEEDSSNTVETSPSQYNSDQILEEMDAPEATSVQVELNTSVHQCSTCTPLSPLNQLQELETYSSQAVSERERQQNVINTLPFSQVDVPSHPNIQNMIQPYTGNMSPTEQTVMLMEEAAALPPRMPGHSTHIPQDSLYHYIVPQPRDTHFSLSPPSNPPKYSRSPSSNPPRHSFNRGQHSRQQQAQNTRRNLPPRLPPPQSSNPNEYRVAFPKPVPRYMGLLPLPEKTYLPPTTTPFGMGYVSRYATPPWLSIMWAPSEPQKPKVPFKYVCRPRKQPSHRHGQQKNVYDPFSDDSLLKFYLCYLDVVGEMDMNILCGPVYCEYLERIAIETKERELSSEYFLNKQDKFIVTGEPKALKVKLSCHVSEKMNKDSESHNNENEIIPNEHLLENKCCTHNGHLSQSSENNDITIVSNEVSVVPQPVDNHLDAQVDDHDTTLLQVDETDVQDEPITKDDNNCTNASCKQESATPSPVLHLAEIEGNLASDTEISGNIQLILSELASEPEDGDTLSQPLIVGGDFPSSDEQSSPCREPSFQQVCTDCKSSNDSSEEVVFITDKLRRAVQRCRQQSFENGSAIPDSNKDTPNNDLAQVEAKVADSLWVEGTDGDFLKALPVCSNDSLQCSSLQLTTLMKVETDSEEKDTLEFPIEAHHGEESPKQWLKENVWDNCGPEYSSQASQEMDKSIQLTTVEPAPITEKEQCTSTQATTQREPPVLSSCFDEDCWQEEPFITFPLVKELKQSDHLTGKEVVKVKPLHDTCSKASTNTSKSHAKIGTPAHIEHFSHEILANCDGMVYQELCQKYRETFKHSLPHKFYVPHDFFEIRDSVFKTVYVNTGDYCVRVVSLLKTKPERESHGYRSAKVKRKKPKRNENTGVTAKASRDKHERTSKKEKEERKKSARKKRGTRQP